MAEADDQPKRCPCGFWGSASTMNLCSQCYKEHLKNNSQNSSSLSDANANKSTTTSSLLTGLLAAGAIPSKPITTTSVEVANDKDNSQRELEEKMDVEEPPKGDDTTERPVQKNKRKCWTCKIKLELAQRELGQCKCGYVFCLLHRLPEQHDCVYDHKDSGRQEAMKNMVDTGRKKIGRSFHRMDSKA